jgi:GAF domain-containing protein
MVSRPSTSGFYHRTSRRWLLYDVSLAEVVASCIWDAVERARAEQSLLDESRAPEILNRIGGALAAELDPKPLIQTLLEAAAAATGAALGANVGRRRDQSGGDVWRLFSFVGVPLEHFSHLSLPRPVTRTLLVVLDRKSARKRLALAMG